MNRQQSAPAESNLQVPDEQRQTIIRRQLKGIRDSRAFCNSSRAKEFLTYAIENAIAGHTELLKERSIGVNLFHRSPTYVTGDDAIVRVKAAEVRKRLVQYYADQEQPPEVRIEIPVGSYIPKFHWRPSLESASLESNSLAIQESEEKPKRRTLNIWVYATVIAILGVGMAIVVRQYARHQSPFDAFWAPVQRPSQPVLICLPTPVTYAVSSALFARASHEHPGMYTTQVDRDATPLQLDPDTSLKWKEITPLVDYSVNKDDAYVATDLSRLFAGIHKSSQVRIGRDFTYEDLRNSPAVLIGAFDNPWTMRVAGELPFAFREQEGGIVETGGRGRIWRMEGLNNRGNKDFAIVARLVNSKTGQFLVIVAGIGMVGTQAAGALASREDNLNAALQTATKGWEGRNLELVLESDVVDGSASPPRVVALTAW
jgi:hypothetical protein